MVSRSSAIGIGAENPNSDDTSVHVGKRQADWEKHSVRRFIRRHCGRLRANFDATGGRKRTRAADASEKGLEPTLPICPGWRESALRVECRDVVVRAETRPFRTSGSGIASLAANGGVIVVKEFDVVIERDAEGIYVASVPAIPGCHTQARSLDDLMVRVREAIEVNLEAVGDDIDTLEFVGVQRITVAA